MDDADAPSGLRERKRKETRQRISDAGLRLFSTQGYEATTLDAVAAAAGISRRTFFHYFKSKDEILLSLQSGLGERLADALERQPGQTALEAARDATLRLVANYAHDELLAIDKLMRSSEAIQSLKQASYMEDERVLLERLQRLWPDDSPTALRLVAMLTVGTSRLALDTWSREGGNRPFADVLREHFATLEAFRK